MIIISENFIDTYLDYYQMDMEEFNDVIDKFANKDLFEKKSGRWQQNLKFLKKNFYCRL